MHSEACPRLAHAELCCTADVVVADVCLGTIPSCSIWIALPSAIGNTESSKSRLLQNGIEAIFLNYGMSLWNDFRDIPRKQK